MLTEIQVTSEGVMFTVPADDGRIETLYENLPVEQQYWRREKLPKNILRL